MSLFQSQVDLIFSSLNLGFLKTNLKNSMLFYKQYRAFYDGDIESIRDILFNEMKEKKIIKKDAKVEELIISHQDVIKKTTKRITAGVIDSAPKISLLDKNGELLEKETQYLNNLLTNMKFYRKTKDTLRKAVFMNVMLNLPVWRDNKLELDVLSPDMFAVIPKDNFNNIRELGLPRIRYDEKNEPELYTVVWSETEHYVLDANGNRRAVANNDKMINPYGVIPVSICRINEGNDFHGEPNSDLFENQKEIDILRSAAFKSELFDLNQLTLLLGLDLPRNADGSANVEMGSFFSVKAPSKDAHAPNIIRKGSEIDHAKSLETIEQRAKMLMTSQGVSSSSASSEVSNISGVSRNIDERETEENREDLKLVAYDYIKDTVEVIIKVNDVEIKGVNRPKDYLKIGEYGSIDIQFTEGKVYETPADKNTRRDGETKWYISTPIDFIMEDKEVDKTQAEQIYNENKQWYDDNFKPETKPDWQQRKAINKYYKIETAKQTT